MKNMIKNLVLRLLAVPLIFILIFCIGATILHLSGSTSASTPSSDGDETASPVPFLPPFPKIDDGIQVDQRSDLTSDTGSIAVKKVKLGTSEQLGNATLMFTPNPYTLKNSLIVANNSIADSDPIDGSFLLKNVGLGSYVINETMSPEGYGPILLKTRVTVHPTNLNPIAQIENRNVNVPFEGTAIVTPPSLNSTSFDSFVRNGATVENLTIREVDVLPPGFIGTTETEIQQVNTHLQQVAFKESHPADTTASEIYDSLNIPTYPAPVKNISSNIVYISPVFVVPQRNESDGIFLLTSIIAKTFPGMSLLVEQDSATIRKVAEVRKIMMQFANESSNVGFSFGISDSIPKSFKLPKPPLESIKFIDVDFVGTTPFYRYTNFSNTDSFKSSPQMGINVDRSASFIKLEDGCPQIRLFTIDELEGNRWEELSEPLRDRLHDTEAGCADVLDLEHFSKFSVGGVRPSSPQTLE
jgi:hypothetical protein